MTLPPCYRPDDEEPADPSRRSFMIGSAVATAGLIVTPLLGEAAAVIAQGGTVSPLQALPDDQHDAVEREKDAGVDGSREHRARR